MRFTGLQKWAPVLLRIGLGVLLIPNGAQKLLGAFHGAGPAGTAAYFAKLDLTPGIFWAWLVIIEEFFGSLGFITGFLTRVWAAGLIIEMIVAIVKVNLARGYFMTSVGAQGPLLVMTIALALLLSGPGPLSVDRAIGLEKPPA